LWRGNAHSYTAFFVESFVNELAASAGIEPLSYRMQMLVGQTRLARCLTGVATLAGWDGGAENSGKGLACHSMYGSHIAVIATARTGEQGVRVERISAVVDCGRLINPELARQQIEGGIIFGLAQALGAATEYENGLPIARRLRDIDLPLLSDIPEIDVEFIRNDEEPGGVSELGVPAVAPAIANALFSAAGVRLRELPLLSRGL
jgi:isoquinoline 1-oxidoreductase beta subunit